MATRALRIALLTAGVGSRLKSLEQERDVRRGRDGVIPDDAHVSIRRSGSGSVIASARIEFASSEPIKQTMRMASARRLE